MKTTTTKITSLLLGLGLLFAGAAFAKEGKKCKGKKGPKLEKVAKILTDKNGDGVITIEDFKKKGEHAERLFARVDEDANGEISEAERDAFLAEMKERKEMRRGKKNDDEAEDAL